MIEKFQWIDYDNETTRNYQMAISYYQQKTDIVMQSLLTGINLKLINITYLLIYLSIQILHPKLALPIVLIA